MALDWPNTESLASLGQTIRKKRETRGWTQEKLAHIAGYSDKIVRNVEHGIKTKFHTIKDICDALEFPYNLSMASNSIISDVKYGSYNLAHYAGYIGIYFCFRRSPSSAVNFSRTVFEILWSKEKKCMEFVEDVEYKAGGDIIHLVRRRNVYINSDIKPPSFTYQRSQCNYPYYAINADA
jgi:transcriptional regulator with XRE-family HTH domain